MAKRVNISVPDDLGARLDEYGDEINKSAVCTAALWKEVERLDLQRKEAEFRNFALEYARRAEVLSELQRTGTMRMPSALEEALRSYTPSEKEGAAQGWTAGTITVYSYIKALAQPTLPYEKK